LYQLSGSNELALYVVFDGVFHVDKFVFNSFWGTYEGEKFGEYTPHGCMQHRIHRVSVAFNAADVDFDSNSLYYIINGQKIQGAEVDAGKYVLAQQTARYEPGRYNLAAAKNIQRLQPDPHHLMNLPTFMYRFPLACTDLENAVLVIDGLYHKGERLPPLKVQMNYIDFAKVPKYTGAAPVQAVQ
jgi:hypothetical protein